MREFLQKTSQYTEFFIITLKYDLNIQFKISIKFYHIINYIQPTSKMINHGLSVLQCKSRPPQPSFRDESQIIDQKGSVQSITTSIRSNTDGSVRISPESSKDQLLETQN
ncbi:hypothetical protein ACTFIY_008905 [Dictyostelium cf. discoideum]